MSDTGNICSEKTDEPEKNTAGCRRAAGSTITARFVFHPVLD